MVALIGQIVFSPLIALAVISLFGLTGGIAVGLILTAAMPGGATAKAFVILGRGSVPLAISLTAATTLATIVTVPLTLQLCAREYVSDNFDMPTAGDIVRDVVCFVFVPLAVGMCLGTLCPRRRQALRRWSIRVGSLVILAMIICALGSQRIRPGATRPGRADRHCPLRLVLPMDQHGSLSSAGLAAPRQSQCGYRDHHDAT